MVWICIGIWTVVTCIIGLWVIDAWSWSWRGAFIYPYIEELLLEKDINYAGRLAIKILVTIVFFPFIILYFTSTFLFALLMLLWMFIVKGFQIIFKNKEEE